MTDAAATITLRLLGPLRHYLPEGSGFDDCRMPLGEAGNIAAIVDGIALPEREQYMVLLNGERVEPGAFAGTAVNAGDEVTMVPPIKGG